MKKLVVLFSAFILSAFIFSCSAGPAGPDGEAGADGAGEYIMHFQNGNLPVSSYAGSEDSRIWSGTNADTNYSTDDYLQLGYTGSSIKRAVIKFDVSALPSNASVKAAFITLYVSSGINSGSPSFAFYRLTNIFVESQVTWNSYYTGNLWTTPGGDYNGTAISGFVSPPAEDTSVMWEINKSVVQDWIDDPCGNYGVLLKVQDESAVQNERSFRSEDYADAARHPKLTVVYTLQ